MPRRLRTRELAEADAEALLLEVAKLLELADARALEAAPEVALARLWPPAAAWRPGTWQTLET
jgi:hypothetical protein